jgi:hypothetical protein
VAETGIPVRAGSSLTAVVCLHHQDGRVVKALDLRSNGHMSAWVRTPLLVSAILSSDLRPCTVTPCREADAVNGMQTVG